jgi:hypothetical protein
MISLRKLFALACVVAVLLAALTPDSAGLSWAILVPFLLFVGAAIVVWAERQPEESGISSHASLSAITSRAPPFATSLI